MTPKLYKLTKTQFDEAGEGEPIPAGTVVNLVSDEKEYAIVELVDQSNLFPVYWDYLEEVES